MTTVEEIRGDGDGVDTVITTTAEASVIEDAKKEIEDADEVNSLDLENAPLEEGETPALETVTEADTDDTNNKDGEEATDGPGGEVVVPVHLVEGIEPFEERVVQPQVEGRVADGSRELAHDIAVRTHLSLQGRNKNSSEKMRDI